ncbi:MAG: hypothetical protein P8R04_05980 [Gammaproteobacteria bacterium]|jgi:hypothetical protein|nr:hypothetical protein [Gammaproteobacteria bacterium]
MATKYYTRFLMQKGAQGATDEYSGVVELQIAAQQLLETNEIEAILAKSFDLDREQVEVLNWSRLH